MPFFGFYEKYDIPDLIKCIAPRHILLVSATEDKYSADADGIEAQARVVFNQLNAADKLVRQRYKGGHALTKERFENIINWIVQVVDKI